MAEQPPAVMQTTSQPVRMDSGGGGGDSSTRVDSQACTCFRTLLQALFSRTRDNAVSIWTRPSSLASICALHCSQAAQLKYRADSLRDGDGGLGSATSLVRRTADLAAEVATLARDLEEKQARLQKNQVWV